MIKYLIYFAVLGWLVALVVHLVSLANINVTDDLPFIWLLHIGIFLIWFPMIFILRKNQSLEKPNPLSSPTSDRPGFFSKGIFKHTPLWLRMFAVACVLYAGVNFIISSGLRQGSPDYKDGQYFLHSRGTFIRTITESEYHFFKANEVRGFSGHWLLFYGVAIAVLFPLRTQRVRLPFSG